MTQSNWDTLDSQQQSIFERIADKPSSDMSAEQWFDHLVPQELQGNSSHVETFMNGGTVTTEEWTYDRGMGNGHYEEVDWHINDRDVSRIESGANGGEYTADNTIMEDSSINRSRGADNMTDAEYLDTVEANEAATEVIAESFTVDSEPVELTFDAAAGTLGETLQPLFDGILPAIVAYKAGRYVHDNVGGDKQAWGWLAAGSGAWLTWAAFTNPITAPLATGAVLLKAGHSAYKWNERRQAQA